VLRSLLALAVLSFFGLSASADARPVTLWACHGPSGGALGAAPIVTTGTVTGSCDAPGTALRAGSLRVGAPAGTVLKHVFLGRHAQGPGYVAKAASELERLDDGSALDAVLSTDTSGDSVLLSGGTIDLRAIGLTVEDSSAPAGTVKIPTAASGTLALEPEAEDTGIGLAKATLSVDGAVATSAAFGVCAELSPDDATVDRALGADCPSSGRQTLSLDTAKYANGQHFVGVTLYDGAGNSWALPEVGVKFTNAQVTPTPTPTATETATPEPTATATATPLVNATVTPVETPQGGILSTTATHPRLTTRDFLVIPKRPKASKGKLTLTAKCPLQVACSLKLSLTKAGKAYGTGRLALKPGKQAKVALKLTKSAQSTLKRKHALQLRLVAGGYEGVVITLR